MHSTASCQFVPCATFANHPARNDGSEQAYNHAVKLSKSHHRTHYVYRDNNDWHVSTMPNHDRPDLQLQLEINNQGNVVFENGIQTNR